MICSGETADLQSQFNTIAPGLQGPPGDQGPVCEPGGVIGVEISGRLNPCIPTGGIGMVAHTPGRSFSVRLPFNGDFIFSHVPEGTHTILFELNGNVIGTLPGVVAVAGQTTDVGTFITPFCLTDADGDGDGVTGAQGDYDNRNPNVFPGLPEVFTNNIDNNCDGNINENCPVCTDNDSDGFFGVVGCGTQVDCNDAEPSINPSAFDYCDNVDTNCNGQVDDDIPVCSGRDAGLADGCSFNVNNSV